MGTLRVKTSKRYRRLQNTAGVEKYVHQHRAEQALGKSLPLGTVVHHADGSKADDAPLVICQDEAYHRLLHLRMRIVRAGGDPETQRVCSSCGVLKSLAAFHRSTHQAGGRQRYCKTCHLVSVRDWIAQNRAVHLARRRQRYAEGRQS